MKRTATTLLAASVAASLLYVFAPPPRRLKPGSVVVITGGSRGLGLALARQFGKGGMKMVLASRKQEELEQARHTLLHEGCVADEDDILLVSCDLTDQAQCSGLINQAIRTFGRIDCLVNNAAIIEVGPAEDQPLEAYRRAMDTTFYASLHTIYAAMPYMLRQGAGAIVNIASIGGKIPVTHLAPYVAAKFALVGLSETLHGELRTKGVRVTTVCPGLMRTGGESHAKFVGDVAAEKKWFDFAAGTPGIAVSAESAAKRIYAATQAGRAEITISPQAWLAARAFGLMPETVQIVNALVNAKLLPPAHGDGGQAVADPSPS